MITPQNSSFKISVGIRNVTDFSPFGVELKGRNFEVSGGGNYRYSFQGQESDDEVKGDGNSVNYKYRMHDPRLGRFFAVDPLAPDYAMLTPYQFSSNSPIFMIELEGLEGKVYIYSEWYTGKGRQTAFIGSYTNDDLDGDVIKYIRKDYNEPDGETIWVGYAERKESGEPGTRYNFIGPDSEKPNSGEDLNKLFGLTATKKRIETEAKEKAQSEFNADRAKDAPLAARIFVKLFPPTAIVDALNTLFTGTEMNQSNVEVTGTFDRYISPLISLVTGGLGTITTVPKVVKVIDGVNSAQDVIRHVKDSEEVKKLDTNK